MCLAGHHKSISPGFFLSPPLATMYTASLYPSVAVVDGLWVCTPFVDLARVKEIVYLLHVRVRASMGYIQCTCTCMNRTGVSV